MNRGALCEMSYEDKGIVVANQISHNSHLYDYGSQTLTLGPWKKWQ